MLQPSFPSRFFLGLELMEGPSLLAFGASGWISYPKGKN